MVLGMLANKDAAGFLKPFAGLLTAVYPVPVPGHEHHSPQELARAAKAHRISAVSSADGTDALKRIARAADNERPPIVLIAGRSEEHTSELQSLMRISYAVFCLKKKQHISHTKHINRPTT